MKHKSEFENFDAVMGGLLSVPYSELQKKLADEKKAKTKKKKQPVKTASSRVLASRKRRVASADEGFVNFDAAVDFAKKRSALHRQKEREVGALQMSGRKDEVFGNHPRLQRRKTSAATA